MSFLRRILSRNFGPLPQPATDQQAIIPGQTVLETLYSDSKQQRAIITVDTTHIYRIHIQVWDASDWNSGHEAFWSDNRFNSLTDGPETARAIALNQLGLTNSGPHESTVA